MTGAVLYFYTGDGAAPSPSTIPMTHDIEKCCQLNIPHVTEHPCFITFKDSLHKQQLLKYSIELSLSSIILVQKPTQIETDIPEISPSFRRDTTLCVYCATCYGDSYNIYRTCLVKNTTVHKATLWGSVG